MLSLPELRQRQSYFLAAVRAAGGRRILTYRTPCCGELEEGIAAGTGELWDTGATCTHCGATYWKESTDERITASLLPATRGAA